jgi:hypothetical protein
VSAGGTKLKALTQQLSIQWAETKEYWRDDKCREFDEKYMQELLASVDRAVGVIEQLDKLVKKIRSDCE